MANVSNLYILVLSRKTKPTVYNKSAIFHCFNYEMKQINTKACCLWSYTSKDFKNVLLDAGQSIDLCDEYIFYKEHSRILVRRNLYLPTRKQRISFNIKICFHSQIAVPLIFSLLSFSYSAHSVFIGMRCFRP